MITDFFRRVILGKRDKFKFVGYKEGIIDFTSIDNECGIYIHVPFCKSICPYCPYNKEIYEKNKAKEYSKALLKELTIYKNSLVDKKITSIYIGGGSPALLSLELKEVIDFIKNNFNFTGDIGIEIYPSQVNKNLLQNLKEMEINMISLGVQTFNDDKLKFLGRCYSSEDVQEAITLIKSFNFKCLDIDIMTNIPGQTIDDIVYDLKTAYSYDIDQISIYPLIVFPMTSMDRIIREKGLSRFSELEEKRILQIIDEISIQHNYKRSSIWTYGKDMDNRYTSVTRESFIGIGAGASSLFSNYFYLNTFNVNEYINSLNKDSLPINIVNIMTEREKMIFWLFWRCYDGVIGENRFYELFNRDMKNEFRLLFTALKILKMIRSEGNKVILTDLGRFAYHYVEKQYSIHYLDKLWQSSMQQPWIKELNL
ncbi:coproporphyrinogen-III oxidase family protein [Clostridium aciditolerans]|uniref:Heme chaperone HemW n=1 Tax=Clostridium aciditolerans TaxID=339861 RepID=A0A934M8R7_9CLOT|nr:coproporphyrinogen-III oxidase family protein [Clostridium aciditolerans]MBI6875116.1 coproporphyrinogen III oxidase family protein [Clostridium aciditolerans]